jgi:hypothetical protein
MTLAALKKEVLRLPISQRVQVADAVFGSLPVLRPPLSFEEREKRADEALSSSATVIGADECYAGARKLIGKIARHLATNQRRPAQRG